MSAVICSSFEIVFNDTTGVASGSTTVINPGRAFRIVSCKVTSTGVGASVVVQQNDGAGLIAVNGTTAATPGGPIDQSMALGLFTEISKTTNLFITIGAPGVNQVVFHCIGNPSEALTAPDLA
jgi:hypothetical protein